ncbi:MAG: insulinase family protein [Oscillospiraceae bacterium]|nr:insulinase family protein [Oscillospiraceae bacterium]
MDVKRREILPFVYLTTVRTDRFKTGCMSATLLTQLSRETASMNALLPRVLRRGTRSWPDMAALQARLDSLYGACVEPNVYKLGEIQAVGFFAEFCDERFLPEKTDVIGGVAALLGELFLSPATRGGLLLPAYVEGEQEKLIERIEGLVNNKRAYAQQRLIEEMCPYEDYAVSSLGSVESAEGIYYVQLSRHYKDLLASSPLELFYCGSAEHAQVEEALLNAFLPMPRGELNEELGTDIRMNTVEEEARCFEEEMDVQQGQLVLGFRLGDCMEEPDFAVLRVLNALYGGSSTSKLFMNVREKLSLCYTAGSVIDRHKGLLIAYAGIDFAQFHRTRDEMLAQLAALQRGEISDEELSACKKRVASALRGTGDSPAMLESFYLDETVLGLFCAPEEMAALVEDVTVEEVVAAAQGIRLDAVYFLKGEIDE